MEPLVRWLLGGFVVSLLFIVVARWFWKRYDQPSEAALEWQKNKKRSVRNGKFGNPSRCKCVVKPRKLNVRRVSNQREVAASSGKAPDAKTVSKAFESLGTPVQQSASTEKDLETESDDSDVELVPELVQVRQDAWDGNDEQPDERPQEPDWELVERLKRIAGSDETEEVPHPEIPEAPSLPNLEEPTSEQFHSWLTEEE